MQEIADFLSDFPKPIYFVGGCVRDKILGIEPHDYDMCSELEPDEVETWIKSKGKRPWELCLNSECPAKKPSKKK